MKVAVIGANGQLGSDVAIAFSENGDDVRKLTHADIELASMESVRASLGSVRADVVVNTAAMHNVESCEREPAAAYAVNAIGARNLALVVGELDARLVHVSTDYVFDGSRSVPYLEIDTPLPLNVYGNSKLAGEHYVRTLISKHFVVRTSALYGSHRCRAKGGKNFVELMLELATTREFVRVINDEFITPTPTSDVARQIVLLSQSDSYGLYHATSEGSCSWHEFTREIFSEAGIETRVEAAQPNEFPAKAPRPHYSVLENRRLKDQGINVFGPWQQGLQLYLGKLKAASAADPAA